MLGGVNDGCFRVKNIFNNIFVWYRNGPLSLGKLGMVAHDGNARGVMICLSSCFNNNINMEERSTYEGDHVIMVFKI